MRRHLATSLVHGLALAALLGATPSPAGAQPFSREDLPPSLRPWVPWVLDQVPTLGCATVEGQAVCVWPGQLRLDLGPGGGTFGLDLAADRAADVRLPGTVEHWPQDVRVDGAPAPSSTTTARRACGSPPAATASPGAMCGRACPSR